MTREEADELFLPMRMLGIDTGIHWTGINENGKPNFLVYVPGLGWTSDYPLALETVKKKGWDI